MKIKKTLKTILIVVGILVLVSLFSLRYYQMAEYRGCGYNPINQLFFIHECWCEYPNSTTLYAGFICGDCEEACTGGLE